MGMLLKYADIIGDREIDLTEEEFAWHSTVSITVMSLGWIIFAFSNIETCFMSVGCVFACLSAFKLDVIEHIIPFALVVIIPIPTMMYFKDASWNNVDLSGDGWERGLICMIYLTISAGAEEYIHEYFDDHPNPYVNFFFDIRPLNHIMTGLTYWASTKNMLVPKKYNKLVDWWTIFMNVCFSGFGYELVRRVFKAMCK